MSLVCWVSNINSIKYFGEKNSILTENKFSMNIDHHHQPGWEIVVGRTGYSCCILDWFHAPKICWENYSNCKYLRKIRFSDSRYHLQTAYLVTFEYIQIVHGPVLYIKYNNQSSVKSNLDFILSYIFNWNVSLNWLWLL